ncbi:MAG: hypothetical protein EBZ77_00860 [Chitinophagia bacterium]|nr:hypothetical protein [Chitinophagia bacterium]
MFWRQRYFKKSKVKITKGYPCVFFGPLMVFNTVGVAFLYELQRVGACGATKCSRNTPLE